MVLNLEIAQKYANKYNGKCLSNIYINKNSKLEWQCKDNHKFYNTLQAIKIGIWCPYCKVQFKTEHICKKIFEELFEVIFEKSRLKILNGKELDGYNKELKIAFEYNGYQHYEHSKIFNKNNSLKEIKKRDKQKIRLCIKNNIKLIIIPYWIELKNLKQYIIEKCEEQDILVPFKDKIINLEKFDIYNNDYYNKIKKIAITSNCECLTNVCINAKHKMKFKCKYGHIFENIPNNIFTYNKITCAKCSNKSMKTIEDMHKIAQEKNGKFLSLEVIGVHKKYLWQCQKGHQWEASYGNIKHLGQWCPYCSGNKRKTIEDMIILAKKHNGFFISNEYKGIDSIHLWKCNNGHIFETTPYRVSKNRWCLLCNNKKLGNKNRKKLTIHEMQMLAQNKNGKCLTNKYLGSHIKLKWQCQYNHIFYTTPNGVKNRSNWCPFCHKLKYKEVLEDGKI